MVNLPCDAQNIIKYFDDTASYAALNIPPVINAAGILTSLGGCRKRPEAIEAMRTAADCFNPFEELQKKAGENLVRILGVPAQPLG